MDHSYNGPQNRVWSEGYVKLTLLRAVDPTTASDGLSNGRARGQCCPVQDTQKDQPTRPRGAAATDECALRHVHQENNGDMLLKRHVPVSLSLPSGGTDVR